jgi:hypothetical protein
MFVIFCNNHLDANPFLIFESSLLFCDLANTHHLASCGITTAYSLILESTMSQSMNLSLEQQFSLRSFENQVERMSREQAQDFLIQLYEQMIVRENMYKHFLKHQWGLEPSSQLP